MVPDFTKIGWTAPQAGDDKAAGALAMAMLARASEEIRRLFTPQ